MALELPWVPVGGESCCCPETCCLYPWPNDGFYYPSTDLPATIRASRDGGSTWVTLSLTMDFTYTDVDGEYSVEAETLSDWRFVFFDGDTYNEGRSGCLVANYDSFGVDPADMVVEDEFLDTYTVTFAPEGYSATLTRVSLCVWETSTFNTTCTGFDFPKQVRVVYDPSVYKWFMTVVDYIDADLCQINEGFKADPQSSPTGDYDILGSTFTVS